jgi:hypothetical protein
VAVIVGVVVCSILPYIFRKNISDKNGHPIPPGPLLRYSFLRKYPERALSGWAQKYGPMFSLWMGDQLFIIISDPVIAKDILVNNGAIFSSRKKYFIKNQTILHGRALTASVYGERWYVCLSSCIFIVLTSSKAATSEDCDDPPHT